ncbi:1-acyl-sn-glycerol-3-phosphate acyltransferase [Halosquirtibacter laminarini]|uniref:1-acyl-sn-glycerol-3-phosphate acyltransferase n=1 Tax=Halosquirtibacter laminarini TaxID=3374600 RepID=A0AC61NBL2_9BACT|nr:1-acyl-sn-glycerol-3-phosphate acyltransferase [Prolixibacteraceae bacterium]
MMNIFVYILSTLRLILLVIVSFIVVFSGLLVWYISGKNRKIGQSVSYIWANASLWLLNIKIRYYGDRPKSAGIVMANHQGYLDIFVLLAQGRYSIIAKQEIGKWPIVKSAAKMINMILVNRGNASSMIKVMRTLKEELEGGNSIILFPEGKTNAGNKTAPFKRGSFKVATELEAPVTPVSIIYHNPKDSWTGSATFIPHFLKQMGKWRTEMTIVFAPSIQSGSLPELMKETKEVIDKMLEEHNPSNSK